jgi:O-antigen/teichoic acid export membrane protein
VAAYSVGTQVFNPVFAILPAAARPLWPIFAHTRVTGIRTVSLRKVLLLFFAGTTAVAAVIVLFAQPIARLVSGDEVHLGVALPLLLGGACVVQAVTHPMAMALMYPAGLRIVSRLALLATPINLLFSILVAGRWGAVGVLWVGLVVSMLLQVVPAAAYLYRHGLAPESERGSFERDDGPDQHTTSILAVPSLDEVTGVFLDRGAEVVDDPPEPESPKLSKHEIGSSFSDRWRESESGRTW